MRLNLCHKRQILTGFLCLLGNKKISSYRVGKDDKVLYMQLGEREGEILGVRWSVPLLTLILCVFLISFSHITFTSSVLSFVFFFF